MPIITPGGLRTARQPSIFRLDQQEAEMNHSPTPQPLAPDASNSHTTSPSSSRLERQLDSLAGHLHNSRTGPIAAETQPPPLKPRPAARFTATARAGTPADPAGSLDEPWRPAEPGSFAECGVSESQLEGLILRLLLNTGERTGRGVAEHLKLPFRLVQPLLERLKSAHRVAYKQATETNDYVYVLTAAGRQAAHSSCRQTTYWGACPVPLADYIASVGRQSIEHQSPKKADLERAFADLLISPRMLQQLGPAISSGRGMFLFGPPGNGKSSIAERVTAAFGRYIWIPRTIEVEGAILKLFDPMVHHLAMPETPSGLLDQSGFDKRWVRIKRPTIVVGGELTMDMLEVQRNSDSNISEAPLQLKSNCGTLVIDDFGRQKMSIDQLLNRWIVPLEKRHDYLNFAFGKKIRVPFNQLVIFSTNLEPKDLVDEAFLRRIPYKIEVPDPSENDFRRLFELMCAANGIPHRAEAVDYLIRTHYLPANRPFRHCHPRDLLLQVKNHCLYNEQPIELTQNNLELAVANYFSVI